MADFLQCWPTIVGDEGSKYTNLPNDKGGPTKWGITQRLLATYRGHAVTADDVAALEEPEAQTIAKTYFWRFDGLTSQALANKVCNEGFNEGLGTAVAILQGALKRLGQVLAQDGKYGPATEAAANSQDGDTVLAAFIPAQVDHYWSLVAHDCAQGAGWGWTAEQVQAGLLACQQQDLNGALNLLHELLADGLHVGDLDFIHGWLNRAHEAT